MPSEDSAQNQPSKEPAIGSSSRKSAAEFIATATETHQGRYSYVNSSFASGDSGI